MNSEREIIGYQPIRLLEIDYLIPVWGVRSEISDTEMFWMGLIKPEYVDNNGQCLERFTEGDE